MGTEVTWVNHDDIPHTILEDEQGFHSSVLDTDQSFRFRFSQPGRYPYHCSLHPHMVGTVVVTPAPTAASSPGSR